jgi:hypothetical protein
MMPPPSSKTSDSQTPQQKHSPHPNTTMTHTAHSHTALASLESAQDPAIPERKHQEQYDRYPAAWRSLIEQLEVQQLGLRARRALGSDWSDKDFVEGSGLPASTWNMLRTGKHPVPTTARGAAAMTRKLDTLTLKVREVDLRIADAALRSSQTTALSGFVRDVNVEAIIAALGKCSQRAAEMSEERLVVVRAATGEGKTWLRKWLVAQGHVHYTVQARPAWKSSYTAFLRAVAGVLRLDVTALRGVAAIEAEIIDKAQTIAGTIWFEEIQRLSVQAQEFIKLLLNETHLAVIISLTPEAYITMKHTSGGDFAQLFRRAACNMELRHADAAFLRAAAPDLWRKSHEDSAVQRIITEAARFGGRALIADICRRLTELTRGLSHIPTEKVEAALSAYRANVPDFTAIRRAFGQKVSA